MPKVRTPSGGAVDLFSMLFRNRIIFIGEEIDSRVSQKVISQLVTLASIDEEADIMVCLCFLVYHDFAFLVGIHYAQCTTCWHKA